jgi:tetratricopeptide (TPR) repeat protein
LIEEFESAADKMASWIATHSLPVVGVLVLALAGAFAWERIDSGIDAREEAASNALDEVQTEYLVALGGAPGSVEIPELANPVAAAVIQEEYLERFRAAADAHRGTVAGTLALFEAAEILERLDRPEQTLEVWQQALDDLSGHGSLRAMLHQRIARLHEARDDWTEAAASHEAAGSISEFPLRYWALAEAARCYAQAGQAERALTLYEQVAREAPDLALPSHLRAQFRELRAVAAR